MFKLKKGKLSKMLFWRALTLLIIDVAGFTLSTSLSFLLRFNWNMPESYVHSWIAFLVIRPLVYVPIFLMARMYTRAWRYAGVRDIRALILAITCASLMVKLLDLVIPSINLPLSVWLSTCLLTLTFTCASRLVFRLYGHPQQIGSQKNSHLEREVARVLIYGAGSAGAIVARESERHSHSDWDIVGFIDDDARKQGLYLHNVPVLGTRHDLSRVLLERKIDKVLIAIPSLERSGLANLVRELEHYKVPILFIPPFSRWAVQDLYSHARPVQVEDLLGRDPQPVDVERVGAYVRDSVVLVTGAGGSIGSEICRQISQLEPALVVLLGRGENSIFEIQRELSNTYPSIKTSFVIGDVRDRRKMEHVFQSYRPDVVFHAAAHKHVPLMEPHPDEALLNNIVGMKTLAELSTKYQVKRFVLISSDKAVRPTNVMGASKRVAEMILQQEAQNSTDTCFVSVRFGNVLGSRGSVVRVFREQIAKGGPVSVTDERMIRYFMTIPEAVRLVIEAGANGENGHVYLLNMGEPVRILDLAERMIRLSGFEPGVDIPIQITGIRPGEKLFEELSRESDSVIGEPDDQIWSVKCPVMPEAELSQALDDLMDQYQEGEYDRLAEAIKALAWWEPANPSGVVDKEVESAERVTV